MVEGEIVRGEEGKMLCLKTNKQITHLLGENLDRKPGLEVLVEQSPVLLSASQVQVWSQLPV